MFVIVVKVQKNITAQQVKSFTYNPNWFCLCVYIFSPLEDVGVYISVLLHILPALLVEVASTAAHWEV